jgi:DNA-binding winged helix-turn-helix (wHTH) protein
MRLAIGAFTFDSERRQLLRGDEPVRLSPKAYNLLEVLLQRRPTALSKPVLCETLWPETFVVEANLANLVRELREALGDDARKPRFVRTVHGFGYAFAAETSERAELPAPDVDVVYRLVCGSTEIDLRPGENVFGRDRHAHIWLSDASVSRRHARIVIADDRSTLEDLGSKNGTFHRGARLAGPASLADGDDLAIGFVAMTFRRIATDASTVSRSGRGSGER